MCTTGVAKPLFFCLTNTWKKRKGENIPVKNITFWLSCLVCSLRAVTSCSKCTQRYLILSAIIMHNHLHLPSVIEKCKRTGSWYFKTGFPTGNAKHLIKFEAHLNHWKLQQYSRNSLRLNLADKALSAMLNCMPKTLWFYVRHLLNCHHSVISWIIKIFYIHTMLSLVALFS